MFIKLVICLVAIKFNSLFYVHTQSTCPVIITNDDLVKTTSNRLMQSQQQQQQQQQQHHQKCKCGIKIDGSIYIYCARKNLNKIPKFIKSSILYDELILSGNSIRHIPSNVFKGIKVKRLILDDNKLDTIEHDAFIELANYLEELTLDVTNQESSIPESIFENLLNLKILKLKNFKLQSLKSNLFNKTRKIESISMCSSQISEFSTSAFNGIESIVREINLDDNFLGLNQLNVDDFLKNIQNFKRIQSITLSRNRIKRLNGLKNGQTARLNDDSELTLDLSFNEIQFIDENAFNGFDGNLRKLFLSNNELSNAYQFTFLKSLVNLKELYLDYNRITSLPENVFINLKQLEVLSLKGNLIYELNNINTFSGLQENLKKLNLASNKIASINDYVFIKTSKLRELNLERNVIKNLSKFVFNGLESDLKVLNLESNLLDNQQLLSLEALEHVEYLKLGSNSLKTFDQTNDKLIDLFKSYKNLTYLDLAHNELTRVPYFKHLNDTLVNLIISNNKICTVNMANVHRTYGKLINLNLNSNQLYCDCNLLSLRNWLMANSKLDYMHLNWKCTSGPNELLNRLFTTIDSSLLKCNQKLPATCDTDFDLTLSLPSHASPKMPNSLIKNFFIDLKYDNKISLYWELNNDNLALKNNNDYYYVDDDDDVSINESNQDSRLLSYYQISYSQMIDDKAFNTQTTNLKDTSLRNYDLNEQLSYNAYYNLCFSVYFDGELNYEKRCQLVKTKDYNQTKLIFSIPDLAQSSKISLFNTQLHSDVESNLFFKFETKQILYGSLVGAIIVCVLIIGLIILIRNTKVNKSQHNSQVPLNEQLQQQQKILLIRPISTINSNPNQDSYLHYSTYTTDQVPPIDHSRVQPKKESKLNKFLSFLFGNSRTKNDTLSSPTNTPQQQQQQQPPYLLSEVLLYPNYAMSQPSSASTSSTSSNTSNLSTTFETLTTTINSNSHYQHMYHEICDTLSSGKATIKYFKPPKQLIDVQGQAADHRQIQSNQWQSQQTQKNFISFDAYCDNSTNLPRTANVNSELFI